MYINFMIVENKNNYVAWWLLLITFLVGLMIVVGGLTRLTDSGLSITKWDLFSGILPPLNLNQWEQSFLLYKQIPEFYLQNSTMTLEEFKFIYWWEYAYRLLGRLIGLFYLMPLIFFTYKKYILKKNLFSLYLILFLIMLQGVIGWYMVQSGLTVRTDVSHYRLALHLIMAFIIFILVLWNYLQYKGLFLKNINKTMPSHILFFFIFCLLLQITIGAFVSGLDAGQIYQSWPLMNQQYFPDDVNYKDLLTLNSFETPSIVQFIHRNMAYFIFFLFILIGIKKYKDKDLAYLRKTTIVIFSFLLIQILLGILTLVSNVNILIASMHQLGSIFLISSVVILLFKNSKIN